MSTHVYVQTYTDRYTCAYIHVGIYAETNLCANTSKRKDSMYTYIYISIYSFLDLYSSISMFSYAGKRCWDNARKPAAAKVLCQGPCELLSIVWSTQQDMDS